MDVGHGPPSGAGADAGDGEPKWTGNKRPRHRWPSSPTRDSVEIGGAGPIPSSSDAPTAPDNQEPPGEIVRTMDMDMGTVVPPDELAYQESDFIGDDEFLGYLEVLATGRRLDEEQQRELYELPYQSFQDGTGSLHR